MINTCSVQMGKKTKNQNKKTKKQKTKTKNKKQKNKKTALLRLNDIYAGCKATVS